MKTKAFLSAVMAFFFALCSFFLLIYLEIDNAVVLSVITGLLFYALLLAFLLTYNKILDKRYAELEKNISSPIFYKTNGNFKLADGKIKNSNIYFCEDGIALISLDEKPYIMEEIQKNNIYKIQCDDIHFNINTNDEKLYIITIPDAETVFKKLKEKDWIVRI